MFYNPFYQETVSGNLNQKQMNNPTTSASAEESDLLDDITDQSQNISNNEICPTEVFTNPFKNEGDKSFDKIVERTETQNLKNERSNNSYFEVQESNKEMIRVESKVPAEGFQNPYKKLILESKNGGEQNENNLIEDDVPRSTAKFGTSESKTIPMNEQELLASNKINNHQNVNEDEMEKSSEFLSSSSGDNDDTSLNQSGMKSMMNNPLGLNKSYMDKSHNQSKSNITRKNLEYSQNDNKHFEQNLGNIHFQFDFNREIEQGVELRLNDYDEHILSQLTDDTQDLSSLSIPVFKNNLYQKDNSFYLNMTLLDQMNASNLLERSLVNQKAEKTLNKSVSNVSTNKKENNLNLQTTTENILSELDPIITKEHNVLNNPLFEEDKAIMEKKEDEEYLQGEIRPNSFLIRNTAKFGDKPQDIPETKISHYTKDNSQVNANVLAFSPEKEIEILIDEKKSPGEPLKNQNADMEHKDHSVEKNSEEGEIMKENISQIIENPLAKFSQLDISKISIFEANHDNEEFIGNVTANNVNMFLVASEQKGAIDADKKTELNETFEFNQELNSELKRDSKKNNDPIKIDQQKIQEVSVGKEETQIVNNSSETKNLPQLEKEKITTIQSKSFTLDGNILKTQFKNINKSLGESQVEDQILQTIAQKPGNIQILEIENKNTIKEIQKRASQSSEEVQDLNKKNLTINQTQNQTSSCLVDESNEKTIVDQNDNSRQDLQKPQEKTSFIDKNCAQELISVENKNFQVENILQKEKTTNFFDVDLKESKINKSFDYFSSSKASKELISEHYELSKTFSDSLPPNTRTKVLNEENKISFQDNEKFEGKKIFDLQIKQLPSHEIKKDESELDQNQPNLVDIKPQNLNKNSPFNHIPDPEDNKKTNSEKMKFLEQKEALLTQSFDSLLNPIYMDFSKNQNLNKSLHIGHEKKLEDSSAKKTLNFNSDFVEQEHDKKNFIDILSTQKENINNKEPTKEIVQEDKKREESDVKDLETTKPDDKEIVETPSKEFETAVVLTNNDNKTKISPVLESAISPKNKLEIKVPLAFKRKGRSIPEILNPKSTPEKTCDIEFVTIPGKNLKRDVIKQYLNSKSNTKKKFFGYRIKKEKFRRALNERKFESKNINHEDLEFNSNLEKVEQNDFKSIQRIDKKVSDIYDFIQNVTKLLKAPEEVKNKYMDLMNKMIKTFDIDSIKDFVVLSENDLENLSGDLSLPNQLFFLLRERSILLIIKKLELELKTSSNPTFQQILTELLKHKPEVARKISLSEIPELLKETTNQTNKKHNTQESVSEQFPPFYELLFDISSEAEYSDEEENSNMTSSVKSVRPFKIEKKNAKKLQSESGKQDEQKKRFYFKTINLKLDLPVGHPGKNMNIADLFQELLTKNLAEEEWDHYLKSKFYV